MARNGQCILAYKPEIKSETKRILHNNSSEIDIQLVLRENKNVITLTNEDVEKLFDLMQ